MMRKGQPYLKYTIAALGMTAATAASSATVISEVLYDAGGPDTGNVFVELFGTPGTVLDGLVLEGVNGSDGSVYRSVTLAGVMPADGVFVVGDDAGSGTSLVGNTDMVAGIDFQNGPDSIVLRDGGGVLDAIGYGDFSSAVFAGEGSPAADVAAGWSLARANPAQDTGDNALDFIGLDIPTPGIVPAGTVPVPAAAWLFMSGITGLLGVSRRKD